jgi:hypothetical protein
LNIDLPDWETDCPQLAGGNRPYYYMLIGARLITRQPAARADPVTGMVAAFTRFKATGEFGRYR